MLDCNEYVMGWYSSPGIFGEDIHLSITNKDGEYRIDPTTLSIHSPDMLDSQGNKIFASLQEDGKGGDIIRTITYPVNNFQDERELDSVILFDGNSLQSTIVSNVSNYNNIDIEYIIKFRHNSDRIYEVVGVQQ